MTPTSTTLLAELKTLHPLLIDLSLGRIEGLLARLGHPERRLSPVVHIAGTNGKGSTTAYLKAFFEAAGKRVHIYTSPHLVRFHERISVPGADGISRPISEAMLVTLLQRVAATNAGAPMTFFEITTAAALLAFAEIPADAVILEVGLGGRLDATNVIARPALTVLTPIAMDHADKLGDTIEKIAYEKAGILKPDVTSIVGPQPPEALDVIRARARAVRAQLITWGEDFDAFEQNGRLLFQSEDELTDLPLPALVGPHQIINAGVSIAAAQHLRSLGITDRAIEKGLGTVRWPACSASTAAYWPSLHPKARSSGSTAGTIPPVAP
jgi:dihydrofolate synthase / folylpolyglutamate synthase